MPWLCNWIGPSIGVSKGKGAVLDISNSGGASETRDAVANLYPTVEEARITCAIVDAAAKVRDLNFKYMAEGKGATVTARFGKDGITICDPNRAGEGATKVFEKIYDKAI